MDRKNSIWRNYYVSGDLVAIQKDKKRKKKIEKEEKPYC